MRETSVSSAPHLSLSLLLPQEQTTSKDLSLQVSWPCFMMGDCSPPHGCNRSSPLPGAEVGGESSLSVGVFCSTMDNGPDRALCFCSRSASVLWVCTNRGCFLLTLPTNKHFFMHGTEVHGKVSINSYYLGTWGSLLSL